MEVYAFSILALLRRRHTVRLSTMVSAAQLTVRDTFFLHFSNVPRCKLFAVHRHMLKVWLMHFV